MYSASENLYKLAVRMAKHRNRAISTISRLSTGSGMTISNLIKKDTKGQFIHKITTDRFLKTLQWFSDNWPVGLEWPSDIARPARGKGTSLKSPQLKGAGAAGASHIPVPSLKGEA